MCNPRRVVVRLAQAVREEWSRTVEAHVVEQTEISAQTTLETHVNLAAELGDIALAELRALLSAGYGGWQPTEAAFSLDMGDGITLHYTPETGHLRVLARLSETVQAAAAAQRTATGVAEGTVTEEGRAVYYDDGYGGRTAETAQRDAVRDAERRIAEARQRLVAAQQQPALDAAQQEAQAQAQAQAQAHLREEVERRQAILQDRLDDLLRESEDRVQMAISNLLGQTYRRAIIRLVEEGGGTVVRDETHGPVLELEARI